MKSRVWSVWRNWFSLIAEFECFPRRYVAAKRRELDPRNDFIHCQRGYKMEYSICRGTYSKCNKYNLQLHSCQHYIIESNRYGVSMLHVDLLLCVHRAGCRRANMGEWHLQLTPTLRGKVIEEQPRDTHRVPITRFGDSSLKFWISCCEVCQVPSISEVRVCTFLASWRSSSTRIVCTRKRCKSPGMIHYYSRNHGVMGIEPTG